MVRYSRGVRRGQVVLRAGPTAAEPLWLELGRSYEQTGGTNQSGLHRDRICDLRQGGRMEADGRVVQADGKFRL